jgi:hypothetical protein
MMSVVGFAEKVHVPQGMLGSLPQAGGGGGVHAAAQEAAPPGSGYCAPDATTTHALLTQLNPDVVGPPPAAGPTSNVTVRVWLDVPPSAAETPLKVMVPIYVP